MKHEVENMILGRILTPVIYQVVRWGYQCNRLRKSEPRERWKNMNLEGAAMGNNCKGTGCWLEELLDGSVNEMYSQYMGLRMHWGMDRWTDWRRNASVYGWINGV